MVDSKVEGDLEKQLTIQIVRFGLVDSIEIVFIVNVASTNFEADLQAAYHV